MDASRAHQETTEIAAIFDRVAECYDAELPYFETFAAGLVEWCPARAGARVLDVGTGRGACLVALAPSAPRLLMGVDVSQHMLFAARKRCAMAGIAVGLVRADAHHLPFSAGCFHVLYCASSWPFFEQPDRAACEFFRVGGAGARLALSVMTRSEHTWPFLKQLLSEYRPAEPLQQAPAPGDPDNVAACLARSGWRVDSTHDSCRQFEFVGAEQWLAWQWSHYGRRHFEQVQPDHLSSLLDRVIAEADIVHRQTGLRIAQSARFYSALAQ